MRLNINKWKILKTLYDPKGYEQVRILDDDIPQLQGLEILKFNKYIKDAWDDLNNIFISVPLEVQSKSYTQGMMRASNMISVKNKHLFEGCALEVNFIMNNVLVVGRLIFEDRFSDKTDINGGLKEILLYVVQNDGSALAFVNINKFTDRGFCFISKALQIKNSQYVVDNHHLSYLVFSIMGAYAFKKYAPIETKHVNHKQKIRNKLFSNEIVFENNTPFDVTYMDCTWFTNIIRTEGFGVKGHLRLQPYKNKNKEWDYKIIYIDPYEKKGYVRIAKLEKESESN